MMSAQLQLHFCKFTPTDFHHILSIYLLLLTFFCSFPFVVGIVISAVMFSVIDSSVNTVIVCFAEGPAEFEQNHPELSLEMHEGWRKVYPEECGF